MQITAGQALVTSGSNSITGVGTDWINKVRIGGLFKVQGEVVQYQIAEVSDATQQITIVGNYVGTTGQKTYAINMDFTPTLSLPEISFFDVDWQVNITRALRLLDSAFGNMVDGMVLQGAWNAATNTPPIPIAAPGNAKWMYRVEVAGNTAINGISTWEVGDSIISNGAAWFRIPTTLILSSAAAAALTSLLDCALHFHASDRERANHTGTQSADTVVETTTRQFVSAAEKGAWNAGIAGLIFKGVWNAATNTPQIPAAAPGNQGWFFRVETAGTTNIDGIAAWSVGDEIISTGTVWQRIASADAPAFHGSAHLPGGIDPIPVATNSAAGLMSAAMVAQLEALGVPAIIAAPTAPSTLPVDGIWIDTSARINFPPSIQSISNQSIQVGNGAAIPLLIADPENVSGCTLSATSSNQAVAPTDIDHLWFTGTGANRTLHLATLASVGSSLITITCQDEGGLVATSAFTLNVGAVVYTIAASVVGANGTLNPVGDIAVVQGANFEFTASPDAGYYALHFTVDGTVISGVTSYTFTNVQGNHTISVEFATNTAPSLAAISNQTVAYQTATAPLAVTIGDTETVPGNLVVTAVSSNSALIPNDSSHLTFGGSGANRTLTVTPANGLPAGATAASATITVEVSDGSLTAQRTFSVTVNPPAPSAQTGLTATVAGSTQVDLTWAADPRAVSYNAYFTTDGSTPTKSSTKLTGISSPYNHTGLASGTTYKYIVTGVNATGESVDGSVVTATPTTILTFEASTEGFTLTALPGAAPYRGTGQAHGGSYALVFPGGGNDASRRITTPAAGPSVVSFWTYVTNPAALGNNCQMDCGLVNSANSVPAWIGPRVLIGRGTEGHGVVNVANSNQVVYAGASMTSQWYQVIITFNTASINTVVKDASGTELGNVTTASNGNFFSKTNHYFHWLQSNNAGQNNYIDDIVFTGISLT
jgi:hypothetical protein